MIGADILARLWARPDAPPPPAPEPKATSRPSAPAFRATLTELQCAMANFELVDEVMRADEHVPSERDRMAHVYAAWALAMAAERLGGAYRRDTNAGTVP